MQPLNTHEKIKLQISAFLFNSKADAMRSEMYQSLCLYVLNEIDDPLPLDELTENIAYSISPHLKADDSLKAVIADELNHLESNGYVGRNDNEYYLKKGARNFLPDTDTIEKADQTIQDEIERIAKDIDLSITPKNTQLLYQFYIDMCQLLADNHIESVTRGINPEESTVTQVAIPRAFEQLKHKYNIDKIIDSDEFLLKTFIEPDETLAKFLLLRIHVSVIFKLLTWDPSLEYLKTSVLSNKKIYLDTSILFPLALESHPQHEFFQALIRSSCQELNVKVLVQEITLKEYESVVNGKSHEFHKSHRNIRQVVKIYKNEEKAPYEVIDDQIFQDYVYHHPDHIDLGSWQRYSNKISRSNLEATLDSIGVKIDRKNTFVRHYKYRQTSEMMVMASAEHASKKYSRSKKTDVTHDTQMYHLITENRNKSSEAALGYDTYLITRDGSLVDFTKIANITWSETFFLFPNQWYELTFPFLRFNIDSSKVARSVLGFSLSPVLSKLRHLIPLEMYGYIFDLGGVDLSAKSVSDIVKAMSEERLVTYLDPSNKDLRERQKAELKVQRMIADEIIEEKQMVEKARDEAAKAAEEARKAENELKITQNAKAELDKKLSDKEARLEGLEERLQGLGLEISKREELEAEIEKANAKIENANIENDAKTQKIDNLEQNVNSLEAKIAQKDDQLEQLNLNNDAKTQKINKLQGVVERLAVKIEEREEREEREKIRNFWLKSVASIMILLLALWQLNPVATNQFDVPSWIYFIIVFVACYGLLALINYFAMKDDTVGNHWIFEWYSKLFWFIGLGMLAIGNLLPNAIWDWMKSALNIDF